MAYQMTHLCEHCRTRAELYYIRCCDAYLCDYCAENAVEDPFSEDLREEEQ